VESISELQSEFRRKAASAIVKLFIDSAQQAQTQGAFRVPPGQTLDAFALRLGLAVEYAMYLNFMGHSGEPNSQYKDKLRMILHNVKNNPSLRNRLLKGSLSPNDFSRMSSNDMASKELQEKTAEMLKEAEKQHTLIQEDGLRIRRTHKGEEVIGDDSQHITTEPMYANVPRRRESEMQMDSPTQASPRSPNTAELPHDAGYGAVAMSPTPGHALSLDTKGARTQDRKSSAFNMEQVWSSVDSAGADTSRNRHFNHHAESTSEVQADVDIDHLLKDEDADEEEPYSPTDYDMEPGTIWRGSLSMPTIADFRGSAKYVAGANLSTVYPWASLMPSLLAIEGRIDVEKATAYLCGLQWSKTTDVTVVAITPSESVDDQTQFEKLFTYFTYRKRYGVISKSPNPLVRDIYLVPLEAGVGKKPEFIELLEDCVLEDPRPTPMLLAVYVIKTKIDVTAPSILATPRNADPSFVASPLTTQVPPPHRSLPPASHDLSPTISSNGGSFGAPAPPPPPPQQAQAPTGMEAARLVLGDMANSPSIHELLNAVPTAGLTEFDFIREVFESVPASRHDMNLLMELLSAKMRS
jgi:hypothetical protein